jgi:hypothetical protein
MIHQCYFAPEHTAHLFDAEPYRPFGLEPIVNVDLTRNCPELNDTDTRTALAEYGAMLHLWRNPGCDTDSWIGFTSYRQLTKTAIGFRRKRDIELLLARGDYVTWYMWWLGDAKVEQLRGTAAQAEANHPGIHRFTQDVLSHFGMDIPASYSRSPFAPFANYWVMSRERFTQFMQWSWPIVKHAMTLDHSYLSMPSPLGARDNKRRAVGYFMERMFVLWTHFETLRPVVVGPIIGLSGQPLDVHTLRQLRFAQQPSMHS